MVSHLRSRHPDIDRLLDHARAQGFRVELLASTHIKVTPPIRGSPQVVISGSPSDWRATYAVKSDLRRAGVIFPEAPKRKRKRRTKSNRQKEQHTMPRTTKTSPTTVTTTRVTRVPSPRPAPKTPAAPIAPLVSAADEARALREQANAVSTLDRGLTLEPMKLDADLAHLGGGTERPPVKVDRRRKPDEVAVVYRGRKKGMLHDQHIQIIVPDEDNAVEVAALEEIIPGLDDFSQRAEWHRKARMQGLEKDPVYVPLHDRLTLTGITYDFTRGEATFVHEDDLAYILAYPAFRLERVDTLDPEHEPLPMNTKSERNRARRAEKDERPHGPLTRKYV